jgi:integral membrane protein
MINIRNFRTVSVAEGVSLLLLYFFAMPMKYIFNEPIYVKHIGMAHGLLFVLYVLFAIVLFYKKTINFKAFVIFNLLSLIPFGFYILESRYFKKT